MCESSSSCLIAEGDTVSSTYVSFIWFSLSAAFLHPSFLCFDHFVQNTMNIGKYTATVGWIMTVLLIKIVASCVNFEFFAIGTMLSMNNFQAEYVYEMKQVPLENVLFAFLPYSGCALFEHQLCRQNKQATFSEQPFPEIQIKIQIQMHQLPTSHLLRPAFLRPTCMNREG